MLQGWFMSVDEEMYYAEKDVHAKVQSSTLNEELGQVRSVCAHRRGTSIGTAHADRRLRADLPPSRAGRHQQISHIFSDKTGTLTQNKMIFRGCVVGTKRYGDRPSGMSTPASASLPSAGGGAPGTPGFRHPALDFDATELLHDLRNPANPQQAELLREFLVNLAVCNSIIPEQRVDEHGEPRPATTAARLLC